ncbi:MbtH family protein [Bordetella genomosp. 13]|uniref:MbtH family protein n=1 Tax=Bordetella genomosp. 13 TaxID=463040 RepID=A0A1W6ZAY3_9BORD|nr:MbtH family NRPS accessory protein [Bordetella genomosp. 13]ARP93994.1 MbtH family protein [Bordetella genomosp. 13]
MSFDRDDITFHVVINDEDQYSIWPDFKPVPTGWRATDFSGDKAACLAHIEALWTDMRPASLRRFMDDGESVPA